MKNYLANSQKKLKLILLSSFILLWTFIPKVHANNCSTTHSILTDFKNIKNSITDQIKSAAQFPDPFSYRPDGSRYISDKKIKALNKESMNIALGLISPQAGGKARYLALFQDGTVKGFTSMKEIVTLFKNANFTSSVRIIGITSQEVYGYWNAAFKKWERPLWTDEAIAKINSKLSQELDPLVPIGQEILIDSQTRLPYDYWHAY
jgi:hypothetical protein